MIPPLTLLPATAAGAAISAGWLPSADPVEWLAEIARCQRQGRPVRGYLVARSPADPRPAGIFLIPADDLPDFGLRVQPLRELLPGVHAPLGAKLSATLLPHEREFFFRDSIHFFHPSQGLVGFDEKDRVHPVRLLKAPDSRSAEWNRAVTEPGLQIRLQGFSIAPPPDPEALMEEAAGDIGSQKSQPPSGGLLDKVKTLGKGLLGGILLGFGGLLGGVGGALGTGGGRGKMRPVGRNSPGQLEKLHEWARKNWRHLADRRQKEIDRLMKLMDADPDAGLRYALPLNGPPARGIGAPGSTLGPRSTIFSHGNSGGAADAWGIERQDRLRLEQQYRQAAQREIELGRHDRAAYIYGNLLGDWIAAARALAAGGRFQDALAIYLHKLNNRMAAARMLEVAGLLLQAASYYTELKQFEKAGDLHAQLGNDAQAREMWRSAVAKQSDPVLKARLLSDKLGDDSAAMAVLNQAWLLGQDPKTVITEMFEICKRHGEPMAARTLLKRIFEPGSAPDAFSDKLHIAFHQIDKWPHELLRKELERQTYTGIAEAISRRETDSGAALKYLNRLAPQDGLLLRDVRRAISKLSPPRVAKSGPPRGVLKPAFLINLPLDTRGFSIVPLPHLLSVAGYYHGDLHTFRIRGGSFVRQIIALPDDPGSGPVAHIAMTVNGRTHRVFHFVQSHRLHMQEPDRLQTPEEAALSFQRGVLALCSYPPHEFLTLQFETTSSLTLHVYTNTGSLRQSIPLEFVDGQTLRKDWLMVGRPGHIVVSTGDILAWRHGDGSFAIAHLAEHGRSLQMSPPGFSPEVLLCSASSVTLFSPGKGMDPPEAVNLFSRPDSFPVACYLPDGSIVIAAGEEGQILPPGNRSQPIATFKQPLPAPAGSPLIDICARDSGGFAILGTSRLAIYDR